MLLFGAVVKRTALILTLILALFVSLVTGVLSAKSSSKTITVPDDHPTIQEAIDNATAGDTVFVKKGIYQEQTLEINKPLLLIGEDVNETTVNLDPPLVEKMIFYNKLWVPSTAVTINADNVTLSGLTLNMPRDEYGYSSGVSADGDRIEMVGNKIGNIICLGLRGNLLSITDNMLVGNLIVDGSNQTIARNSVEGHFKIHGSFNKIIENTLIENPAFSNPISVALDGSFSLIMGNVFSTMYSDSNSSFISNNTCAFLRMNYNGHNSSSNIVCNNRVTGRNRYSTTGDDLCGILAPDGSHNVFHDNIIKGFRYGISVHSDAEHTTFYRNIFVSNFQHVVANGEVLGEGNSWDNGKEGNYWDDYKGSDNNSDGIGDVPYPLGGLGRDNYPLMAPFDIDSVSIKLPEWASVLLNPSSERQTSESFPVVTVAASVIVVVVVAACLLVYFKKRNHVENTNRVK